jgi:hypothetical protein
LRVSIQGDEVMDAEEARKKRSGEVTPGGMSDASFPIPGDEGNLQVPMQEHSDDEDAAAHKTSLSGLKDLSFSREDSAAAAVGGLDDSAEPAGPTHAVLSSSSEDESSAAKTKKRKPPAPTGPKRRRTRRKIVIDNDATELEGDHIKSMLRDTSDIVLQHVPHPADWHGDGRDNWSLTQSQATQSTVHDTTAAAAAGDAALRQQEESIYFFMHGVLPPSTGHEDDTLLLDDSDTITTQAVTATQAQELGMEDMLLLQHLSFEELLARPSLGDDGQLAPELLQLWRNNLARVRGKPFPYPKRKASDQEEEEEDEQVEVARGKHDGASSEEEEADEDASTLAKKKADDEEEEAKVVASDGAGDEDKDQGPMPMNEESSDEEGIMPMGDEEEAAPQVPLDEEEEEGSSAGGGKEEEEDPFGLSTWGMVNDAFGVAHTDSKTTDVPGGHDDEEEEEDEEGPRQEAGTELVSSSSKWHKHTIRVLQLLQRNMGAKDGETLDPKGNPKPDHLSFDTLSKNCSRRTASGVFFETLQLKTWDFIEVDQGESYGDITVRFVCLLLCRCCGCSDNAFLLVRLTYYAFSFFWENRSRRGSVSTRNPLRTEFVLWGIDIFFCPSTRLS